MKKFLSVVLGLSLGAALLTPNFASAQEKKDKPAAKKGEKKKVVIGNKKNDKGKYLCPVSGDEVKKPEKAQKASFKDKTYLFCCPDCKPKFDKDPAKYAKAEKKDEGKGKKTGEGKGEKKG